MSVHDRIGPRAGEVTEALYAALDALDAFAGTAREVVVEQEAATQPNQKLIGRINQFENRAQAMIRIIEDEVLDHLNAVNDRLFSIEATERGEFI